MVRGIFITREDAAALPNRITAEGYPESNTVHSSHHQRPPRSHATAWGTPVTGGAPSAASSARTDISAIPSNHEKWTEGEIELLINLRAEKVGFKYIAVSAANHRLQLSAVQVLMVRPAQDRFPGKNQKAVQEKFYKAIKDPREPHWQRLYSDLRAQHDGTETCPGTFENPIDISDEGTMMKPIEISSGTVSETTTVAEPDENRDENFENAEGVIEAVTAAI